MLRVFQIYIYKVKFKKNQYSPTDNVKYWKQGDNGAVSKMKSIAKFPLPGCGRKQSWDPQ